MTSEKSFLKNGVCYVLEKNNSDTVVILAHGFRSNKNHRMIVAGFNFFSEKFDVLRFDFRGNGDTEMDSRYMSIETMAKDVDEVVSFCRKKYKKIFLIALSMGASAVLLSNPDVDKIVFWSPLTNLRTIYNKYNNIALRTLIRRRGYFTTKGFHVGKLLARDMESLDLLPLIPKIKAPTLIVHSRKDRTVPFSDSEQAFELLTCKKEFFKLEKAKHTFKKPRDEKAVLKKSLEWLEK